jgi:Na+-translocating ferredoxin:NAD+ oxidoreductase subunit C
MEVKKMKINKAKSHQNFKEKGGFIVDISMKMEAVDDPFTEIPPAEKMIVFLRQHIGIEAKPVVGEGESVKYGQILGDHDSGELLGVPIHSPVDGRIMEITKMKHPLSKEEENVIIIEKTGEGKQPSLNPLDPKKTTREQLLKRVKEAGIVGLGGAAFPTHVKLAQSEKIEHLIINAKESDPNIACDYRLIVEKPQELIEGIKLMAKILDVESITYATRISENKTLEFDQLLIDNDINIARIQPCYSVGSEKLLVKEVLEKEVPSGKYPPAVGALVHNIATAYAVERAIIHGKPLVSRGLTFYSKKTGGKNLWVRMGTPIEHIFNHMSVSPKKFDRVVLGSLMMGPTIPNPSYPILKATSGITAFTKNEPDPYSNPLPCIRCGYCNIVCPVSIYPQLIMEAEKKEDAERLIKLHVEECIDCGLCSYVCPSRIKFTKYLIGGKKRIQNAKN